MSSGGPPREPAASGPGHRTDRRTTALAIAGLLLLIMASALYLTRGGAEPVLEPVDTANPYPYLFTESPGRPIYRGRFVKQIGVAVTTAVLSPRAGVEPDPEGMNFLHLWVAVHNQGSKEQEVTGETFVVEWGGEQYPLRYADGRTQNGLLDITLSPGETNVRRFAFVVPAGLSVEDAMLRFELGGGAQVPPVKPISP